VSDQLLSKTHYEDFRRFLEEACGIVLGENKHYLVTSRLNRLIHEFSFQSLHDMLGALKANKDKKLRERVIDAMTTNETSWFRDNYPYDILTENILPDFIRAKPARLRIWSAAASYGQEPYSIAMILNEFQAARPGALSVPIEIVGTDISSTVLTAARKGVYDDLSMARGISPERRKRFFTQLGQNQWEISDKIRGIVRFNEFNLLQNYSLLGRFDVIFCRNVLIYFSPDSKTSILDRMAQILNPGGYLILGGSETPSGYSRAYDMIRYPKGVVYRIKSLK
jgi:chemotaxis protein methyltransferase CheR